VVYLNDFEFKRDAGETLGVLAEIRMDDEVLSGAEIERHIRQTIVNPDCEEAAGAADGAVTLGNQMISELLVRNIARGYMLAIDKNVIRMV
jgi:hypothetical protein